jgi:LysR family transcriptional regulator, hca operon transcriptional activator
MEALRDKLPKIDVTVSSHYSRDVAELLARGNLGLAFLLAEPGFDLDHRAVRREKYRCAVVTG